MTVIVVRQTKSVIKVTPSQPKPVVKTRASRGLPGVPGLPGETGPQGPPGPSDVSIRSYTHSQSDPLEVWTVNHNLGYRPGGVIVVDSAGTEVEGIVSHIDSNTLTITFLAVFGGFAYLS